MKLFQDIKRDLEKRLKDISSIEHTLIIEQGDKSRVAFYRHQQTAGDSVIYMSNDEIDPAIIKLFNESISASVVARTGLSQFLIECLTK